MQNLPRNSVLKYALRAPTGYKFIDCDSSQIEARTLAWWAGQDDLVTAFERGDDVYKIMASAIYGKPVEEINKDERRIGKGAVLGAGYGMAAAKFQMQMQAMGVTLSLDECQRIIAVYRQTYNRIPELWKQAGEALVAMMNDQTAPLGRDGVVVVEGRKGIRLPNGLYLRYPNLRWHNDATTGKTEMVYDTKKGKSVIPNRIYGGKVVENCCQAIARIIIGEQLIRVSRKYRVALTVHDAIGVVVPEAQEAEGLEFVEQCMRTRPVWAPDLPLNCEGGSGESYGDC
jgi:DNA polymerase